MKRVRPVYLNYAGEVVENVSWGFMRWKRLPSGPVKRSEACPSMFPQKRRKRRKVK